MPQDPSCSDRRVEHLSRKIQEFFGIVSKATRHATSTIIYDPNTTSICKKPELSSDHYEIKLSCLLKNFPNKNSEEAIDRSIHIFLSGEYILNLNQVQNIQIEKYGTKIYYCNSKHQIPHGNNIFQQKISAGIHYDGDVRAIKIQEDKFGKIAHPFFHMQFDNSAAREPFTFRSEKHNLEALHQSSELRNIRIPTSQMDMFSSLIVILYDHLYSTLNNNTFNQIIDQIQKHLWKCLFPNYAHNNDITNQFPLLPSYWYPCENKIESILRQ